MWSLFRFCTKSFSLFSLLFQNRQTLPCAILSEHSKNKNDCDILLLSCETSQIYKWCFKSNVSYSFQGNYDRYTEHFTIVRKSKFSFTKPFFFLHRDNFGGVWLASWINRPSQVSSIYESNRTVGHRSKKPCTLPLSLRIVIIIGSNGLHPIVWLFNLYLL